jgi:succinoglycan biosynthesis transport protein ExoP
MGSMLEIMKKLREQATPQTASGQPGAGDADTDSRFQAGAGFAAEAPAAGGTSVWDPQRIDPAVVAFHDRYSSVCEQFRSIRARLLSMNSAGTHRVIAITSSIPQEGKSACTMNLGIVMAEGGEYLTLIADADFRRSSIGKMLGLEGRPGLAELIRGSASLPEVLCSTPFPNLFVLPPGRHAPDNLAQLLGCSAAREVLAQLRRSFAYTFVDLPPVNTVSDVSMLAPSCDSAILVLQMGRTPEPTAAQAVRTLQANNVKLLGCIITRCDDRRSFYYDRYGYYYREG